MAKTPRPHQAEAIATIKRRKRVALFWEMRLGKTLVILRWLKRHDPRKALILCPSSVIDEWVEQAAEEGIDVVPLRGFVSDRIQEVRRGGQFFVTNYEGLHEIYMFTASTSRRMVRKRLQRPSELLTYQWDAVVCDESTRIRKPKSEVTKAALKHLTRAPLRAVMSGMPDPERREDLVTQMIFAFGDCMGKPTFYYWQRVNMMRLQHGELIVKSKSKRRLAKDVAHRCMSLRRKDVGFEDPYVRQVRRVELPSRVLDAIRQAEKEFRVGKVLASTALEVMQFVARLAGGRFPEDDSLHHDAKIDEVVDLLQGELHRQKVIVWARYSAEIDALHAALRAVKMKSVRFYGRQTDLKNDEAKRRFKTGDATVFIGQAKKGGLGLDLSCASATIYFSNWFDYEIRRQSEDRALSLDSQEPMLIVDVAARRTTDAAIGQALKRKGVDRDSFFDVVIEEAHRCAA